VSQAQSADEAPKPLLVDVVALEARSQGLEKLFVRNLAVVPDVLLLS